MFHKVMEWLEADDETREGGFSVETTRIAIAALFYHMVSVDGVVSSIEADRLRRLLSDRYQLSEGQLSKLARRGEATDKSSVGLFPFAVILNREMNESEREEVWQQLEVLAHVDGVAHPLELEMLEQMKIMLKLPV